MKLALLNLVLAAGLSLLLLPAASPAEAREDGVLGSAAVVLGTGGDGLRLRSGAGLSHRVVGAVAEGRRVRILDGPKIDDEQAWYLVRTPDGSEPRQRGWASAAYLLSPERIVVRGDGAIGSRDFQAKVTAYASGGGIGNYTATGTRVRWGTVAVDPRYIPYGSIMTIEGLEGIFVAEDTGPGVQGATVDVWFPDRAAAVAWGTRYRHVTVLREGY